MPIGLRVTHQGYHGQGSHAPPVPHGYASSSHDAYANTANPQGAVEGAVGYGYPPSQPPPQGVASGALISPLNPTSSYTHTLPPPAQAPPPSQPPPQQQPPPDDDAPLIQF